MARATFVKSAQKDIYTHGKRVSYISQKGKKQGQELFKLDRTVPRDKSDKVYIAKGASYWHWQFKNSPTKNISKTQPKQSQLTQSTYLQTIYSIQEKVSDCSFSTTDELAEFVTEIKDELEELKDTTQESLDRMPESLQ